MRVLLFSLHFVEYTVELANALSKYDDVHIVLSRQSVSNTLGNNLKDVLNKKVACTLLDNYTLKNPKSLINLYKITKLILRFRPHVIHHQESRPMTNFFLFFYSLFIPTMGTVHDITPHPGTKLGPFFFFINAIRRFIIRNFYKKVVVHGEALKKELIEAMAIDAGSVLVIPHGALFSFMKTEKKGQRKEDPYTVLFFGRILEYKGLKYLIEAEPLISKKFPHFKIIIAGSGDDLDLYREQLNSNPHFEIHDYYIPNDEVADFFNRSSLVVLPYIEASQSGVVAMSYAFGKPVIVSNVGSLTEIVNDRVNGMVVPPKDSASLALAIMEVLGNNELKKSLGQKAFDLANSVLSWEHIAKTTRKHYHLLVQ